MCSAICRQPGQQKMRQSKQVQRFKKHSADRWKCLPEVLDSLVQTAALIHVWVNAFGTCRQLVTQDKRRCMHDADGALTICGTARTNAHISSRSSRGSRKKRTERLNVTARTRPMLSVIRHSRSAYTLVPKTAMTPFIPSRLSLPPCKHPPLFSFILLALGVEVGKQNRAPQRTSN